jgi:hypothetical protein
MTKWIWKLYKQKDNLWVRLLQAKYMRDGDFFKSKDSNGYQFWKSLHKVKHLFKWGAFTKLAMVLTRNSGMMFGSPMSP